MHVKVFEVTESEARVPLSLRGPGPLAFLLFFIGLFVFIAGISADPKRTWAIFHTNLLFWLGVGQGSALFYALVKVTRGYWSIPVLRAIPYGILILPVVSLLFVVEWVVAGKHIFPYFEPEKIHHHRFGWLSPEFVFIRDAVILLLLNFVSLRLVSLSLSADGIKLPFLPKASVDEETAQRKTMFWSKVLIPLYVVGFTIFGWDQAMYLDPHWYSTLFGARFFISRFLTYLALFAIINSWLMTRDEFRQKVTENYLTNVGTLLFGFCFFWAYLLFAEFIVIYMGNIPEFTHWYVYRIYSDWSPVFWIQVFFVFIFPFILLLNIPIKKNPYTLSAVALMVLVGLFARVYDVAYFEAFASEHGRKIYFGWIEIGITLGFLGLALILIRTYLKNVNLFPMWEVERF